MNRSKLMLTGAVLLPILLVTILTAVSVGSVSIPFNLTLRVILAELGWFDLTDAGALSKTITAIVWDLRLPRVLLAAIVGASLSMTGAVLQGLLRNPLADPFTIGVASGAATGATIALLLRIILGWYFPQQIPLFAFAGALLAIVFVYNLARIGGKVPVVTLLLAGVVVSAFLSSIISFLMVLAGEDLKGIWFWLSGGLALRSWPYVWLAAPYLLIGSVFLFFFSRELNVLQLGEEAAQHLGIDIEKTKKILLAVSSLLTAIAVSVSGVIGFVGLIVPHAIRMFTGPDHRMLLPATAFCGAIFLVWVDVIARTVLAPRELPIGIITAFVGAPFFIWLLHKKKKEIR